MNLAAASLTEQVINKVSEEVGRRGSEEQLLEMQQGFHLQEQLVYELSEISAVCEHFFNKVEADVFVTMAKDAAKELTQLREKVAVLTEAQAALETQAVLLLDQLETQAAHLLDQLELAKHERNEFAGKLQTSQNQAEKKRIMQEHVQKAIDDLAQSEAEKKRILQEQLKKATDELDGIKLALKVQVLLYFMSPLWFILSTLSLPTSPLHSFLLSSLCNLPALTLADQGG